LTEIWPLPLVAGIIVSDSMKISKGKALKYK